MQNYNLNKKKMISGGTTHQLWACRPDLFFFIAEEDGKWGCAVTRGILDRYRILLECEPSSLLDSKEAVILYIIEKLLWVACYSNISEDPLVFESDREEYEWLIERIAEELFDKGRVETLHLYMENEKYRALYPDLNKAAVA